MSGREVRQGAQDGGDGGSFKLPRTSFPEPIMRGVRGWKTSEDWLVLRLHYSADPERTDMDWLADNVKGYRGGFEGRDWRREMEIDFSAYKGSPVYEQFDPSMSVVASRYRPELPLWRGWDFGYRHPAVVWMQLWPASEKAPNGTLVYLHELYPTLDAERVPGIKTADLAQMAMAETRERFPETADPTDGRGLVLDFTDPAGNQTKETSDFSSIEILSHYGLHPEWANVGRKNRIDYLRRYVEVPGSFRINPHCALGIKAFSAAYRYPEDNAGQADREMPDLGKKVQGEPYIHIMDAVEYVSACNLEVAWRPSEQSQATKKTGTLDELIGLYAGGASPVNDRRDVTDLDTAMSQQMEDALADLVGIDGDLSEALTRY